MNVDFNPCVFFSQVPDSCSGRSTFSVTEINTPDSYYWDFGDGDTSGFMNPIHSYPQNGTYLTQLIACNGFGCDTISDSIHVIVLGPTPANCYPVTLGYCCGIGITDFKIIDQSTTLLDNATVDAVEGYMDYTCEKIASLLTDYSYDVSINTGFAYIEKVRIWLDMDNNGILDSIAERLYNADSLVSHTGTILIPSNATNVYNTPLRLRIASDYNGNPFPDPCADLVQGQVEDYTVLLTFNTALNGITQNSLFSIYPNPGSGSFNLKYSVNQNSKAVFIVRDLQGKELYKCSLNPASTRKEISLENFNAGVYQCSILDDNNLYWQSKLILVH
jgi:PKD repeat protein